MCKLNPKNKGRRIDPCMREYVGAIQLILRKGYRIKACCCGHGKYQKTVLIGLAGMDSFVFDLFTLKIIPRKKKFYKRDKQGYYYIPEVSKQI